MAASLRRGAAPVLWHGWGTSQGLALPTPCSGGTLWLRPPKRRSQGHRSQEGRWHGRWTPSSAGVLVSFRAPRFPPSVAVGGLGDTRALQGACPLAPAPQKAPYAQPLQLGGQINGIEKPCLASCAGGSPSRHQMALIALFCTAQRRACTHACTALCTPGWGLCQRTRRGVPGELLGTRTSRREGDIPIPGQVSC